MEAEGGSIIRRFTYTGAEGERIPDDATHVFVRARIVPANAFEDHPSIVEVICHEDVEKIEQNAFEGCPNLRRVIMPGVKVLERGAFIEWAFGGCEYLTSIDLPSVRVIEKYAFDGCKWNLVYVKFGYNLEKIEESAFADCRCSLERITIPLKDGMITDDNIFSGCLGLDQVDLVEGELHETIAALQLEEWRNDMNEEIDSINRILPDARAGTGTFDFFDIIDDDEVGEKAWVIRRWIRSVLRKIIHYQQVHQRSLDEEVATTSSLFCLKIL
eukprot:scaffold2944_cov155-Skeletonema_dohrnii-CCMP3373.AAC.2